MYTTVMTNSQQPFVVTLILLIFPSLPSFSPSFSSSLYLSSSPPSRSPSSSSVLSCQHGRSVFCGPRILQVYNFFFLFLPGASEVWTSLLRSTVFTFASVSIFHFLTMIRVCQCHHLDLLGDILMYGKVLHFPSNKSIMSSLN